MPETSTSPQLAAGIKPHIVFPKNPAQRAADLAMLQKKEKFKESLDNKAIDCIRVDSASDEAPSHHEVQFIHVDGTPP